MNHDLMLIQLYMFLLKYYKIYTHLTEHARHECLIFWLYTDDSPIQNSRDVFSLFNNNIIINL